MLPVEIGPFTLCKCPGKEAAKHKNYTK